MYDKELTFPALASALDANSSRSTDKRSLETDGTHSLSKNVLKKAKSGNTAGIKSTDRSKTDKDDTQSPGLSYIALISMAIQSNSDKKMLLSEIYQWIAERYPYYQMKDKSWRNSIRHNLSLNECFVKSGRSENGKGNYWSIHPANIEDFAKGDYRRRRARRRVRKCDEDLQRLCSPQHQIEAPTPCSDVASSPQDGYVPMVASLVPPNFLFALGVDSMNPSNYWVPSNGKNPLLAEYPSTDDYLNNSYPILPGYSDFVRRENMPQTQYVPYYGRANGSDTFPPTSAAESTLNVNVNVNVCGNRSQH